MLKPPSPRFLRGEGKGEGQRLLGKTGSVPRIMVRGSLSLITATFP